MSFTPEKAVLFNYILNPDASVDVTGWAAFADAAATSPADMTAGSPNTTWARNTSSPGSGLADFLLTKSSGASRQGEGVAYTTNAIKAKDLGQVMEFSFDYKVASGTYVDDALQVWAYDVANSTAIQLTSTNIKNTSVWSTVRCTFQTATNATTYRIGFFIPVTTDSANTLQFSNFYLGRQQKSIGSFVGDWKSVTVTGGWSSNTTYTAYEKIVGDTGHYRVYVALSGAPTSANMTINLPSGRTADTAKISTTIGDTVPHVGYGMARDDSANSTIGVRVGLNSSSQVILFYGDDAATGVEYANLVTQAAPFTFATGDGIHIEFSVPLSGLSSGAVTSDQSSEGRVVAAMYANSAGSGITNNSETRLDFATKLKDTHAAVTTGASWVFTCPTPGDYFVDLQLNGSFASAQDAGEQLAVILYKSGSAVGRWMKLTAEATTGQPLPIHYARLVTDCVAGDTLYFTMYQNSGGTFTLYSSAGSASNGISIFRLGGNQTVMAGESVNARYSSDAGQSIPNITATIVDFEDLSSSSHSGSVTTGAAWKFTAPVSGIYHVNAKVRLDSTAGWALDEAVQMSIYKNGSQYSQIGDTRAQATITVTMPVAGSDTVRLLAGDYIDIRLYQNNGGSVSITTSSIANYVTITRVGNY